MKENNFAFNQNNYIICGISILLIVFGFILMTGPSSSIEGGFEPDIFSTRRIIIAPMVCFFGFLLMIVGILFKSNKEEKQETNA